MRLTLRIAFIVGLAVGAVVSQARAFSSVQRQELTATASVTGGTAGGPIVIQAQPLPTEAFFGKNVVIPVEIVSSGSTINTQNLKGEIVYQLLNQGGQALSPVIPVPIQFIRHPTKANVLQGAALIPRQDLEPIRRGGRLHYYFHATQSGGSAVLGRGPAPPGSTSPVDPFEVSIIDNVCTPVTSQGARISAPDMFQGDGLTSVNLPQGAVNSPATLCLKQEDVRGWPTGPGGLDPTVVYSVDLNTSLEHPAEITLSYPSDINGKVTGTNFNGLDLAPHFLGTNQWRLLSRPQIDTTRHTVTGVTTHFSTFALFPVGAVSAPSLRPLERIITPNGDGINDTATFSGLVTGEDVHLFDVRGRSVRTLHGPAPVWDGKNDDGRVVESGVYLYQYMSGGDRVSGVIAVAK